MIRQQQAMAIVESQTASMPPGNPRATLSPNIYVTASARSTKCRFCHGGMRNVTPMSIVTTRWSNWRVAFCRTDRSLSPTAAVPGRAFSKSITRLD